MLVGCGCVHWGRQTIHNNTLTSVISDFCITIKHYFQGIMFTSVIILKTEIYFFKLFNAGGVWVSSCGGEASIVKNHFLGIIFTSVVLISEMKGLAKLWTILCPIAQLCF